MNGWGNCRNILCIRPDNMGDLLMSAPAMAALRETFKCRITVLTSPMAAAIAAHIPCVDDTIVWQVPWVKSQGGASMDAFNDTVESIRQRNFDAAVIFTVFSQNPLPSALMATLAGIPNRLAYCRENPYELLSHWVEEKEPYTLLRHQVRRDLALVQSVGARTSDDRIKLILPSNREASLNQKLRDAGIDLAKPWLILHPGASEEKRNVDPQLWIDVGKRLTGELKHQVLITGVERESALTNNISHGIGCGATSLAGKLSLEEMIVLIRFSPLLIAVNTGPVHVAAALETKVIVLYALTNPQHTPWRAVGKVLPFSVIQALASRNQVLRFIREKYYSDKEYAISAEQIVETARELLNGSEPPVEELVLPGHSIFRANETP